MCRLEYIIKRLSSSSRNKVVVAKHMSSDALTPISQYGIPPQK
jgi:hypothetical protein